MPFPNRYELAREECYYLSKGLQPNGKPWPKVKHIPVRTEYEIMRDKIKDCFKSVPLVQPSKKIDYFRNF